MYGTEVTIGIRVSESTPNELHGPFDNILVDWKYPKNFKFPYDKLNISGTLYILHYSGGNGFEYLFKGEQKVK